MSILTSNPTNPTNSQVSQPGKNNRQLITNELFQIFSRSRRDMSKTKEISMLVLHMYNDNIIKVESYLQRNLDPNMVIRPGVSIICYCRSIKMLNLLLQYGLDLSINNPLLKVPFHVFQEMIEHYNIDPYKYYNEIKDINKTKYISLRLKKDRELLAACLSKSPLIRELVVYVVDMCYPRIRINTI